MSTLELEITAETSYVAYKKNVENGDTALINSAGSDSSSYYSSSDDEADSQVPNEEPKHLGAVVGRRTKRLNPKLLKVIEAITLASAVAVVLTLFSLPIFFYQFERGKNQVCIETRSVVQCLFDGVRESRVYCTTFRLVRNPLQMTTSS